MAETSFGDVPVPLNKRLGAFAPFAGGFLPLLADLTHKNKKVGKVEMLNKRLEFKSLIA